MNLNGKEYFYIRNVQNDVIGLHDSDGNVVVRYIFDTWGNIVSITGRLKDSVGKKNPYRYRGYRYDEETGMYYLQSRYYNGSWGRFTNADAIIGQPGDILSFNMFAYCHNNPVNMSDESGYLPKWLKKAAKVVKKTYNKVVKKVKAVYNTVKKSVVNTWNSLSKKTQSILSSVGKVIKETSAAIGDSKAGEKLAKKMKPKECIEYSKDKGLYGLCRSYTKTPSLTTKVLNKVCKVTGLVGLTFTALDIGSDINKGDYIGVTKDVLGCASGILIGAGIGFLGITGGWAIMASVGGALVAGEVIDWAVDNTVKYINRKKE